MILPAPGLNPATRQAIQATGSTALAMGAGLLISPTRWYWAVGAYIMFIRATTLGETLVRGWQRIVGTAFGVVAGVLLAHVMQGHPALEFSEMFVAMFLGFYLMGISYMWMVVGITLLLASLYLLLGRYSPGLLLLRLELTLVGCALGGAVAALVLPVSTNVKVRTTVIEALDALCQLVEQSLAHRAVAGGIERTRDLDRKLREAAKPLTGGVLWVGSRRLHHAVHFLAAADTFTRHLAVASQALPDPVPEGLRKIGAHVVSNARAIAEDLAAQHPVRPLLDAAGCIEAVGQTLEEAPEAVRQALYWIEQLDEVLVALGRKISGRLQ